MNLLNIAYVSINKALTTLSNVSAAITNRIFGQPQRTIIDPYAEDIEMNAYIGSDDMSLFQELQTSPDSIESTNRPLLMNRTYMIQSEHNVELQSVSQPRSVRGMKASTRIWIVVLVTAILVITKLLGLFDDITGLSHDNHPGHIRHRSTDWFIESLQQPFFPNPKSINAPGFYLVPADETVPDEVIQHIDDTPTRTNLFLGDTVASMSANSLSPADNEFSESRIENLPGPFHRAYPTRSGRIEESTNALQIKLQLERCANNMLTKLVGQGLEVTAGLEFALHDCKSVIDFALETLYTSHQPSTVTSSLLPERSVAAYGIIPGKISLSTLDNGLVGQLSELRHLSTKRSMCSANFCDWALHGQLDRCYHRNETEYQTHGNIRYLNDSVDDFKDNAPLECNLCLPVIDYSGIEAHCKEVEEAENGMVKNLLVAICVMGGVTMVTAIVTFVWRTCRASTRRRHRPNIPLRRMRVPVMPVAAVVNRGGRLDKRAIGNPMPVVSPMGGVEGAFENPRAAPLPPLA